jgi:uncharacterized membrane protein YfcA
MNNLLNFQNIILIIGIGIMIYQVIMFNKQKSKKINLGVGKTITTSLIGFVTNFFDFFGIGSFAPQTFSLTRLSIIKKEEEIPGTLNLANIIPIVIEAFFFIAVFNVEPVMLIVLVLSAAIGSFFGAKLVSKDNAPIIKRVVGFLMIIAGVILILKIQKVPPFNDSSTLTQIDGFKLVIAALAFFVLGGLQSIGLGLYAPGFAILGLLGLSATTILPINMVASVALMVSAAPQFYKTKQYNYNATIIIMIAGILATLSAGLILQTVGTKFIDDLIPTLTIIISIIIIIDGILKVKAKGVKNEITK